SPKTTEQARAEVLEARRFAASRPSIGLRRCLESSARTALEEAARRSALSGRGVTRLLRVARTIADMDASLSVSERHISEALTYRAWSAR
ncbi:hypothetical protein EG835_00425, partial [bacterium]|nr:hypothetical protein [bacterium]